MVWNDARALELVEGARAVRHRAVVDTALRSYRSEARGFVYFFIDRPDEDEKTLVKADQVALEVYWRAPDQTRQRIVGLRDEKLLPTNIRYHIDHLTVVQDEFEDRIRLGDGDEVSAVTHPVAPGAESQYDYRLADSLTLSFPGMARESVRVYEVRVRPKDPDTPGFIGSLFLDRSTGAIVRMSFTFTPASYVDPYLDYIRISLDNSLWDGKYWLPYRQEAELRRELPQLDFLAGSVIRARFEIGGYEFNPEISEPFFRAGRVTIVSEEEREAFPFEDPIFAQLEEEGLSTPPSLEEIRRQAREMVAGQFLSGLSRLRLYFPSASHALRFNRAEGVFVGAGAAFRPSESLALHAWAGYAIASGKPSASLELRGAERLSGASLRLYFRDLRDLGPLPATSGVVNTLSALLAGEDYTDPWFADGARLALPPLGERVRARLVLSAERHRSASFEVEAEGSSLRPVRSVAQGELLALDGALELLPEADAWRLDGAARLGAFEGDGYGRILLDLGWSRDDTWRDLALAVEGHGGLLLSGAPPQELFLMGGRGTLLGHPFRGYLGDRFWLVGALASRPLLEPWITVRVFTSAGGTELVGHPAPADWAADPDAGVHASAGAGLSFLWDILVLDAGRALTGEGDWGFAFSAAHRFRGWL